MTSDFRQFAICPKTILSALGTPHKPIKGTTSMMIVPMSGDTNLSAVKLQFDARAPIAHTVLLKAGVPLYGVTEFTLQDNPVEVFYFAT